MGDANASSSEDSSTNDDGAVVDMASLKSVSFFLYFQETLTKYSLCLVLTLLLLAAAQTLHIWYFVPNHPKGHTEGGPEQGINTAEWPFQVAT